VSGPGVRTLLVHEFLTAGGLVSGGPETGAGPAPAAPEATAADAALLSQGRTMRDAMLADLQALPAVRAGRLRLRVADCADAPWAAGAHQEVWRAEPGETPLDFARRLLQGVDLAWMVAPESDGLLAACLNLAGERRWIGCDAQAIAVASSKMRTLQALADHGVLTPLAPRLADAASRWVVKPDDGAGCVATEVFDDAAAAEARAQARRATGEGVTLQPWVEGEAMSVSLLCTSGQAQLLSLNRQQVTVDVDGGVRYAGVEVGALAAADPRRRALQRLADRVRAALPGLRGFVGVDLVWHGGLGPVAIEINPRVSCAYAGQSARLGINLAGAVLAACGHPAD
jgi:predicted ATP-grasp superfamily ATP-dependent carboligase